MAKYCDECNLKLGFGKGKKIDGGVYCAACAPKVKVRSTQRIQIVKHGAEHLFASTVENPKGLTFKKCIGPVSARAIYSLGGRKNVLESSVSDFGKSTAELQRRYKRAEDLALEELKVQTAIIGGIGVVGLRVDFDILETGHGKAILVNMYGTAVM